VPGPEQSRLLSIHERFCVLDSLGKPPSPLPLSSRPSAPERCLRYSGLAALRQLRYPVDEAFRGDAVLPASKSPFRRIGYPTALVSCHRATNPSRSDLTWPPHFRWVYLPPTTPLVTFEVCLCSPCHCMQRL
jgi:hypothetical protein